MDATDLPGSCVTGRAYGLRQVNDGVSVTVMVHLDYVDEVAAGLAFAPALLSAAAVEGCQPESTLSTGQQITGLQDNLWQEHS